MGHPFSCYRPFYPDVLEADLTMKYAVVVFLLLQANSLGSATRITPRWVVWNVGQGLWITGVFDSHCLHLDAGGERKPPSTLAVWCQGKRNQLHLSHWDWDHIGGVASLARQLPALCRQGRPGGTTTSQARRKIIESIPLCQQESPLLHELHWRRSEKSANHASRVFVWKNQWLFPGDSPQTEEKKWLGQIPDPEKIRILLLGHHGSQTSTSEVLLNSLSGLRLAIASARRKVYGHPHPKVTERLARKRIPLLRTEEWGHLIFEL